MRIRKHLRTRNNTLVQAHICHFNQSPWDVITNFSPPSSPPPLVYENNTSSVLNEESSVSYVKWEECNDVPDFDGKLDFAKNGDVVEEEKKSEEEALMVLCSKSDGKNWQCPREAISGNSMCEHHLSPANNRKNETVGTATEVGKRRPGTKNASSSLSNPYEFYYYSGFGPSWGKTRGGDENVDNVVCKSTLSQFIDEDLEDEGADLCERKRARKPIKARSLNSLL